MRNHNYWVYTLTNKHCTTLYNGMTNNIARRLYQHRYGEVNGFTIGNSSQKFYDRPWDPEGMIRDSSLRSE